MTITADVQQLEPGRLIELFEVDCTAIGGDVLRFHGHLQSASIWWQGNEYKPWPIQAAGFERTGDAQQPSPTVTVGNVDGVIGAMCIALGDLVGASVRRRRTFSTYLDAVNFPDGNPTADPGEEMPPELWYIEQKSGDIYPQIEFTLASALDLNGQQLPARPIVANVCMWLMKGGYRGAYCGYTGAAYFDLNDQAVDDPAKDKCAGRVASCKCRFGANNPLPYGSFPAADLTSGV
ncbi:phage minor tail protein L [Paraburkholderia tropica]|uniref:phage minor tail protein L n=1 Tax=Paraburkholderia tropica TaxID=92647 RepID=UPI0016046E17|nr:phage minor tail protein L [Paraburkholderia tropica]QNB10827.1 phage minor tail protein L [Paraburkholderia tropica]